MRFSTITIAVLGAAASVSASSLTRRQAELAPCAIECITTADMGDCIGSDFNCLCKSETYVGSTTKCITENCPAEDREVAFEVSRESCLKVGVTLTSSPALPSQTGTNAAPAPSGSASGSGSAPSGSGRANTTGAPGAGEPEEDDGDAALPLGLNLGIFAAITALTAGIFTL